MSEKMIDKVRALLAKAEATDYPEEAKTFTAKAVELMERYAIDEAELRNAQSNVSPFIDRKITIPSPYARAKITLFNAVAKYNRCTIVVRMDNTVHVFGREADIELVELLFTSLLVQQAREMYALGYSGYDVKAWRRSFMLGFAGEVSERLAQAKKVADTDDSGNTRPGALVLLSDAKALNARVAEVYPTLRTSTVRSSSSAGYRSGREAGSRANFGNNTVGGNRRQING